MSGILTYSGTFLLGLIHALEPGHGKTLLFAFSLRKTNLKLIGALLSSLFVSHFLVLGVFAYGLQKLASIEEVEKYTDILAWIAPILIIAYGGYLFYQSRKHRPTSTGCSCGAHHHKKDEQTSSTWRASITGFIAGLMPCPTAIAPLLLAGAQGDFSSSLLHVLVYALGMVITLFAFVGLLILMKSVLSGYMQNFEKRFNIQMLSSLLFIAIGLVYVVVNIIGHTGHSHL